MFLIHFNNVKIAYAFKVAQMCSLDKLNLLFYYLEEGSMQGEKGEIIWINFSSTDKIIFAK